MPIKVNVVSNNVKEATIPNKTIVVNNIIGAGDRPRNLGSGGKTLSLHETKCNKNQHDGGKVLKTRMLKWQPDTTILVLKNFGTEWQDVHPHC